MAKTKREQLEQLVHNMQTFADECDAKDATTAEDVQKLNQMAADVQELVSAIKAEATASDTLDVAKAFLGDLAGAPAEPDADAAKVSAAFRGLHVGPFTLAEIRADGSAVIGCHDIPHAEMAALAARLNLHS